MTSGTGTSSVTVKSQCAYCDEGVPFFRRSPVVPDYMKHYLAASQILIECRNYDSEMRHAAEGLGFYTFAWWPVKCRNNRLRWLTWVERHSDGSYTLGNRAH